MAPTLDKKPECGDLIKIDRGSYQHWAIYIGDSFVVHLAAPSFLHTKAMVKKEKLLDVVGTNKWEINNSLDEKYKPRPIPIFVKEACELVGQELSYSVFRENCEHFVNVLRYVCLKMEKKLQGEGKQEPEPEGGATDNILPG